MNRRKFKVVLILLLIFISTFSGLISLGHSAIQEEDFSNPQGTLINVGYNYWYQGTFYDDADPTFTWTTSKIEFEYIPDPTLTYSHTITSFENQEGNTPESSDIALYENTTVYDVENMDLNDNNNAIFNSSNILGNYPATYGFENDTVGGNPSGWTVDETGGTVNVISDENGHNKVLQITRVDDTVNALHTTASTQIDSTIEFWISLDDVTSAVAGYIVIEEGAGTDLAWIRFYLADIDYHNGVGIVSIKDNCMVADTWYHIKIVMDDTTNTFDIYLDGVLIGDDLSYRYNSITGTDQIAINVGNDGLTAYWDAFGFSWDTNYLLGDNLYYNYYLGNETFESYNQTTSGDYYGTESFDYNTEEGVYYGTYDFRDEDVGDYSADPTVLDFVDGGYTSGTCTISIESDYNGHNNVLKLLDNDADGSAYVADNFGSVITDGTIEFWILTSDATIQFEIDLYEGATYSVRGYIKNEFLQFLDGSSVWQATTTQIIDDTWNHFKFEFDDSANKLGVTINGIDQGLFEYWTNSTVGLDILKLYTVFANVGPTVYIEAIGYSWDTTSHGGLGYTVGHNINPYDIVPLLNAGYSIDLDWNTNIQIVNELDGHTNVMNISDNSNTQNIKVGLEQFTAQTSGIIEYWIRTTDTNDYNYMYLDGDGGASVYTAILQNQFAYYVSGVGWTYTGIASVNKWYHFKFDFDASTDTFDWYVNGTKIFDDIDFYDTVSDIDKIFFHTYSGDLNDMFIDAVSYSWDSNYDVGDNINSHGKEVITALESNGWSNDLLDPYTSVGISGEYNSHKKFLNLTDDTSSGSISFTTLFSSGQTSGTVELWIRFSAMERFYWIFRNQANQQSIYFWFNSGNVYWYDGSTSYDIGDVVIDTWYHFKIEFDCATDTYNVYQDGVSIKIGATFSIVATTLDKFYISTQDDDLGYSVYVDSLSYSWDYTIGTNLHANEEIVINTVISIPFDFTTDPLQISIDSRHFTSDFMNISWSIYNFTSSSWELIDNSITTSETLFEFDNTISPTDYFNGSNYLKLKYYGFNGTAMYFIVDQLIVDVYFKTEMEYQKALNIIGTWKYRFVLDFGLGTEYNSTWIYINVVQFELNVELVSESEYYTKWEFLGSDFTENDLYEEGFEGSYDKWNLNGVSEVNFTVLYEDSVNYLTENSSFGSSAWAYTGTSIDFAGHELGDIYLYDDYFWIACRTHGNIYQYDTDWTLIDTHDVSADAPSPVALIVYDGYWYVYHEAISDLLIKYDLNWVYQAEWNLKSEDQIMKGIFFKDGYFYLVGAEFDKVYKYNTNWVYQSEWWDVSQNDRPEDIYFFDGYWWMIGRDGTNTIYQYTESWVYTGTSFSISETSRGSGIEFYNGYWYVSDYNTKKVYKYDNYMETTKTHNGDGYFYIQTNETETLKVRSNDLNLNLLAGDKIEILFNTSSTNKIDLNLLNNGVEQGSYEISKQGNLQFDTHYTTINIDSDVSIDQLELEGIFDDKKNLFIENIRIYRYVSSGEIIEEIVDPDGNKQLFFEYPTDFTCNVYENSLLMYSVNFTSSNETQVLIYVVPKIRENYITYFDTNNEYLDFNLFTTYINYTFGGESIVNERLSDRIISVDDDTMISFKIYDSFNALVKTYQTYEETFIDITLDVYSLKIKNEKIVPVEYKLKNNDTAITKSGYLFEEEILSYNIATGTYIFEYLKEGESEWENFTFSFTSNWIFVLNRSKMIFLTYSNQRGEFLEFNNYKTYINGTLLYENIFYQDVGINIGIEVKDRYDISIKNESYTVISGDNYVPVILTMYNLKVMNQQEIFNHINITRDPNYYESPYYWSEWIAPNEIIKFQLFAGYYKINLTDNEGGSYSFYTYTLSGDDILLISSDNVISQVIYNIANVNTTIGNQITNVEINITNQNSQINQSIINIEINLSNVNSTLGDLLVSQSLTLTNIQNDIGNMFVYIENNFTSLENNINVSFIDLTNIVYLVNDSIYTAVIGIESELNIINTTISGNLSLAILQNEFLTSLFQLGMFSELLNWTGAGYNSTFIANQIDVWEFINDYRNESVQILLKYQDKIDNLTLSAQNTIEQYLPKEDVEYRLKSVATGEYLSDWEELPENKTINFGFYSEVVPFNPDPIVSSFNNIIVLIILGTGLFLIAVGVALYIKKKNRELKEKNDNSDHKLQPTSYTRNLSSRRY